MVVGVERQTSRLVQGSARHARVRQSRWLQAARPCPRCSTHNAGCPHVKCVSASGAPLGLPECPACLCESFWMLSACGCSASCSSKAWGAGGERRFGRQRAWQPGWLRLICGMAWLHTLLPTLCARSCITCRHGQACPRTCSLSRMLVAMGPACAAAAAAMPRACSRRCSIAWRGCWCAWAPSEGRTQRWEGEGWASASANWAPRSPA